MNNFSEYNFMSIALDEAKNSLNDIPIGALVILDNKIIGKGFNQRENLQDPLGHAEIIAIKEASKYLGSWRLTDCILFSTLEPCPLCAELAIQCRVKKIVFAAYDTVCGAAGSVFNLFGQRKALPSPEIIGGIMELESAKLLKDFFQTKRKK